MADEKEVFKIDLDSAEFVKKALEAKGSIVSIGDSENLSGLIDSLASTTLALGVVGAAMYAVKAAIDLTVQAEAIERTAKLFDTLAKNAGLAGDSLKEGILAASGGLAAEDEILNAANKAMIGLGDNAGKLPQIMELARKATVVYGGTLIDNFTSISQAMALGQTRMLKHYGITVDLKKAEQDYAKSIGVTSGELSEAGKRHAVLNAALEAGKERYAGVSSDLTTATSSLALLKATLKDTADIAVLAWNKIAGPTVRAELQGVGAIVKDVKGWFVDHFGSGAAQAAAHTQTLTEKVQAIKGELIDLEQKKLGKVMDFTPGDTNSKIIALTEQLKKYEAELGTAKTKEAALGTEKPAEGTPAAPKGADGDVNNEKRKQDEAKFNAEILQMKQKLNADLLSIETEFSNADKLLKEKDLLDHQMLAARLKEIDLSTSLNYEQKAKKKAQLEAEGVVQFKKNEADKLQTYNQVADNMAKKNATTTAGFANGFKAATMKAKLSMIDMAAVGQSAAIGLQGTLTAGFKAIGDGSESASAAMKRFFLKAIGDMAVAKGSEMILAGIGELNPAEVAAGGALVALGAKLGSMASPPPAAAGGGSSTSTATTTAPAPALTSSQATTDTAVAPAATEAQTLNRKSVNVQLMGDYFDTDTTRQQLMTMIRNETDATDFKYTQVGKG